MQHNNQLSQLSLSPITDREIDTVIAELGLKEIDEDRRSFIRTLESVDVSACPGSGKTTLLLAKVRLLINRWSCANKGICMLSHTNVAKDEIAVGFGTLGSELTDSGRPHFVGTIHSFINRYLATPYLLSRGIVPKVIDSDVAENYFMSRLHKQSKYGVFRSWMSNQYREVSDIKLCVADLEKPFGEKLLGSIGANTGSYQCAANALRECIEAGYLRPDDILLFAEAYIKENPWVSAAIRSRFPIVFIDEMQDTSPLQATILDMLFPQDDSSVIIQRVGDPNQTIFKFENDPNGRLEFPRGKSLPISNSFRVSSEIAEVASPFAVSPVLPDGLHGVDRSKEVITPKRFLITFEGNVDIDGVLPMFAELVNDEIDLSILKDRDVCAVGLVHKEDPDATPKPQHFPKTIGDYYLPYKQMQLARKSTHISFRDAIESARARVVDTGQIYDGLVFLFETIQRTLNRCGVSLVSPNSIGGIEKFLEELDQLFEVDTRHLRASFLSCIGGSIEPEGKGIDLLMQTISQLPDVYDNSYWESFLNGDEANRTNAQVAEPEDATYFRSSDIAVRLGTVHSVKGETHAATLILDTFKKARYVEKLMPWLLGKKQNLSEKENSSDRDRLATCYVAMTRPTHLLAIATPAHSLGKNDKIKRQNAERLESRGWKIISVSSNEHA